MQESAFPELPQVPGELPPIPGGWTLETINIGTRDVLLNRPANPDLFLDDKDVVAANDKNDYMPYWTFLWPSAIKMANAIQQAPWAAGSDVLELGAGVGLAGLSAQLRGDNVVYSDYDKTALYVCQLNAMQNELDVPEVWAFDWRDTVQRQFPVIIGCEVTYDAAMHPVLLKMLDRLLPADGICWLADPGRYQSPFFYQMALDHGFRVNILNEHRETIEVPSSEGFQIFEITRETPI